MRNPLSRPIELAHAVRGVAPDARLPALKRLARERLRNVTRRARRRAQTGQVRAVEVGFGTGSANHYFWNGPRRAPVWFDVQGRLERLERTDPEVIDQFVRLGAESTSDPTTIFGLARHPASAASFRGWLHDDILSESPAAARRLQGNRLLGGAVAGAAAILLDTPEAERAGELVADLYQLPDSRLFEVRDSFGTRFRDRAGAPPLTGRCQNRLVLAEHAHDADMLALLLPGAQSATVLAASDTFGRADLAAYSKWTGTGNVTIEHVRSRITRFSQEYVDLHEATADVAEEFCRGVAAIPGLVHPDHVPYIDVEAADFLFFQALKIRAIESLIEDAQFDHIVLALADQREDSEFLRLVASVDGLLTDERTEIVSVSRSTSTRSSFWSQLRQLECQEEPARASRRVPEALVMRKLREEARRSAESLPAFGARTRPAALLVTANNSAYNDSTAAYASHLADVADVEIVHMGRNATELAAHLDELDAGHLDLSFIAPVPENYGALADLILDELGPAMPTSDVSAGERPAAGRAAALALATSRHRLVASTVAPAVGRLHCVEEWFSTLAATDGLPDIVVLTPSRTLAVGSVAATARRHGVPSLVLEAHAHDANYSRYLKITSDYYGVMSEYFRDQAIAGLGTDPGRTVVVGSPRQVAPPGYDPVAARQEARAGYEAEHGRSLPGETPRLVFFCQPSDWRHVSKIWSHVLDAARRTGAGILLKTHPEETPTRTRAYLELASAMSVRDQVVLLDCDATTAIALADIAVTAYSAAGLDAAVRQTPVICVTDGDLEYPVDLPAIIGAPMARSADEVAALVAEFQQRPGELERRARSLLEREHQFVDGPGPRLVQLVDEIVGLGSAAVRPAGEVPRRLFLDQPHPLFPV